MCWGGVGGGAGVELHTESVPAYDGRRGQAIVLCKRGQFIAHGTILSGTLCCAKRRLKKEENKEEREAECEKEEMEEEGSSMRLRF